MKLNIFEDIFGNKPNSYYEIKLHLSSYNILIDLNTMAKAIVIVVNKRNTNKITRRAE
jgi:hypothetical protein